MNPSTERREPPQPSAEALDLSRLILDHPQIGRDLTNKDLARTNLKGAKLKDANLTGADLERANLKGANLKRAKGDMFTDLKDANLTDAKLIGANLIGADLTRPGANLDRANLTKANLSDAILIHVSLKSANLTHAKLTGAYLTGANLTGANLERAKLSDAILKSANLTGANLFGANLRGADLTDANLTDANLFGANLRGAIGLNPVAKRPRENEVNPDEREHDEDKALVAENDICNWEAGPYDIKKEEWMMLADGTPSFDRFVVQLPDIVPSAGTDNIISQQPTENYLCLSLFELRRLNEVETQSSNCNNYEFEEFYECRKVLMDKIRRSHRTPLGFGVTDYIENPAYVKIGSYFVEKPTWFWYGDAHRHVPEPRKFKLVFTGEKYLVQKTISVCKQGVVSGVHCDLKDLYSTYELVPIASRPISDPLSPSARADFPYNPDSRSPTTLSPIHLPAIQSLRPSASGGTLIRNKRKSTRRKSTRRKSTRRKSTRRKSTRRKSTRRKSNRR